MHLKISSAKWRPFCPGENESSHNQANERAREEKSWGIVAERDPKEITFWRIVLNTIHLYIKTYLTNTVYSALLTWNIEHCPAMIPMAENIIIIAIPNGVYKNVYGINTLPPSLNPLE